MTKKQLLMPLLFTGSWMIYCSVLFIRYPVRITLLNMLAMATGIVMLYCIGLASCILLEKRNRALRIISLVIIGLLFIAMDQFIKEIILEFLRTGERVEIIKDFFWIMQTPNTNHTVLFAFSEEQVLPLWGNILFKLVCLAAFVVIMIYFAVSNRYSDSNGSLALGVTLTMSASISSIIDTVFRGYVLDYLSLATLVSFDLKDIIMLIGTGIILCSFYTWYQRRHPAMEK